MIMHPSVNYDYLIHGDHIHWCNVDAKGISRCEELAVREHSATVAIDPLAAVGLSILIAMGITIVAGLIWGLNGIGLQRRIDSNLKARQMLMEPQPL
jgi:uncharacterized membrane protein